VATALAGLLSADLWHWKAIYLACKSSDPAQREKAKADYTTLSNDPELGKWFGEVKSTLKDANTDKIIGQIAAILVITVITAGVGDIVAAGALGWGMSAGSTALVVGTAEAATFTLLSQMMLDSNHSAGHIALEFGANIAMFGLMRRFALFAETAKLTKVQAMTGNVLIMAATTFAKADLDKYIADGRHLNSEEVGNIAMQGMVMAIAMHAIAPLTKPLFRNLEGRTYAFCSKLRANNLARVRLSEQALLLRGTKNFSEAQAYVAKERAWLEQRLRVLDEVEAAIKAETAGGKKPVEGGIAAKILLGETDLAALRVDLQGKLASNSDSGLLINLEPLAPGLYSCPRAHIADTARALGTVEQVSAPDPMTSVKEYTIRTADGQVVKIREQLPAWVSQPGGGRVTRSAINAGLTDALFNLPPAEINALLEADAAMIRGDDAGAKAALNKTSLSHQESARLEVQMLTSTASLRPKIYKLAVADVDAAVAAMKATGRLSVDITKVAHDAKLGRAGSLGELEAIQRWLDKGSRVEALPENQNALLPDGTTKKNPDYRVDGVITEVKVREGALNEKWIKEQINNANTQVKRSGHDENGSVELLLTTKDNGKVSLEDVDRQVKANFNNSRSSRLTRVSVFKDGVLFSEWHRVENGNVIRVYPSGASK
jgi:hypothetical protein